MINQWISKITTLIQTMKINVKENKQKKKKRKEKKNCNVMEKKIN